jgi:type 1 glutamine amidotransferase
MGLMAQAPAAPAQGGAPAAGGRGGGRGGAGNAIAPGVFAIADMNKDGSVTQGELMMALEKLYADADTAKAGTISQQELLAALNAALPAPPPAAGRGANAGPACGGQSANPRTPCPDHVAAMTAALPDKAPARPARARKILVLDSSLGFRHSSIPLAAATVEALGKKTGAWTTTISYDPADINTANLKQYDAVFLASTTGCFLDKAGDRAETDARRAALLAFVREGKGLAGIHAATDSYHSTCPNDQPPAAAGGRAGGGGGRGGGQGAQLAPQIVTQADKNNDQRLTMVELGNLATAWFAKLDTANAGRVSQADFVARFNDALPAPAPANFGRANAAAAPVGRGQGAQGQSSWPEFSKMTGGFFKYHWNDGTRIPVKIDDPKNPINKAWMDKSVEAAVTPNGVFPRAVAGKGYDIVDETYTFAQDSFSRTNVRVLTSVDYAAMPQNIKDMEPAPTARMDGDYALSYIKREGKGRVFYEANGHNERVYAVKPMLEHILAGIQYALGDLKADDTPSVKAPAAK